MYSKTKIVLYFYEITNTAFKWEAPGYKILIMYNQT